MMMDKTEKQRKIPARRIAKWLGIIVAGLAALVIVFILLLFLRPVRESILSKALLRINNSLPGDIVIKEASWPSIGSFEFSQVTWFDEADLLLSAERIAISVDLFALMKKDVKLNFVTAVRITADIPQITSRFAGQDSLPSSEFKKPAQGGGFPREGSLSALPSISVDQLSVSARSIRLNDNNQYSAVTIAGRLDLLRGHAPVVQLDTLAITEAGGEWEVESLTLDIDLNKGLISGRGRGSVQTNQPVFISITADGADRFTLVLSESQAAIPPEAAGVKLRGVLTRKRWRMESLAFDAAIRTPGTSDLSRIPALSKHVEGFPSLAGIGLNIKGSIALEPELTAHAACDIHPNDWLDGGSFVLAYDKSVLHVPELSLKLPDLSLNASATLGPDSIAASTDIRLQGSRWLQMLRPALDAPPQMSGNITATIYSLNPAQIISAEVEANGQVGDFTIDHLQLRSDVSMVDNLPTTASINAHAMDLHAAINVEIDRSSGIAVRLAPIVVQTTPISNVGFPVIRSSSGWVRYASPAKNLKAKDVRITGAAGDIQINANIDSTRAGTFELLCQWPEPPALLVRALGISPTSLDSLRSDWKQDAPYRLAASGTLTAGEAMRTDVSASFSLPGPAAVSILLPDSANVDDMGPVAGTLEATGISGPKGMYFNAFLDLSKTAWIDSSVVRISGAGGHIAVDTIGVALAGVHLAMKGSIRDSLLDMRSLINVHDAKLARRFVSGIPDLKLYGDIALTGTFASPVVDAAIDASVQGDAYQIPKITSVIKLERNKINAVLHAPQGAVTSHVQLDRLTAALVSIDGAGGSFPARLSVTAAGEQFALSHSMIADTAGGLSVDIDTLDLLVGGQDLRLQQPFRLTMLPHPGGIIIEDAQFEGSLGTVCADGFVRPDSSNISGSVELTFPPEPPPAFVRKYLWPERMDVAFKATGKHDISLHTQVAGFTLVTQRRPVLDLQIDSDSTHIETRFSIADSAGAVLEGSGQVPVSLAVYPPAFSINDGAVSLVATLDRFPMAVRFIAGTSRIPADEIVQVDGNIRLGGTAESLDGDVRADIDFTGWPKLSKYNLHMDAKLGSSSAAMDSSSSISAGKQSEQPSADTRPIRTDGLAGSLRLEREGRPMMTATISSPLHISLHPPSVTVSESEDIFIEVDSDSIPLEDFDPLFPLEVGLGGTLSFSFTGSGPNNNPALDGTVDSKRIEISVANQARMMGDLDIRIAGSRRKPEIKGEIEIKQALIRVPDQNKELHPIKGNALLMVKDSLGTATDSLRNSQSKPASSTQAGNGLADLDLDVNIKIPSAFWIRGKGLDLELSGDLTVKLQNAKPTVTGELRVIHGTLVTLGRTLELERGVVTFYGGDEIDPSLDVVLGTDIEGTKVQILFGGTAQKPELKFTSEPDMPEADIMSVLLFGRPYGQLDDGQANMVKDRAREMLVSAGTSKLQSKLGEQLGLDVVTVKSTGTDNMGTALSVGKYLKPQVLLSYAYALDKDSDSFVSLEYFLKGQFKIETIFGNQGQTSIGIGWSKDY